MGILCLEAAEHTSHDFQSLGLETDWAVNTSLASKNENGSDSMALFTAMAIVTL